MGVLNWFRGKKKRKENLNSLEWQRNKVSLKEKDLMERERENDYRKGREKREGMWVSQNNILRGERYVEKRKVEMAEIELMLKKESFWGIDRNRARGRASEWGNSIFCLESLEQVFNQHLHPEHLLKLKRRISIQIKTSFN